MQEQPKYYELLAKALISNADGICDAIDKYIAKADEDMKDTLEAEGYAEAEDTVSAMNDMEEQIADILQIQTDELVIALEASEDSDWKEVQQKVSEMLDNDDIKAQVADVSADMLEVQVPNLATLYMQESDGELVVDTLRNRTSNWISSWSEELGNLMKINTHNQITDLIQSTIDNGEDIASLTRKILDGGWRNEYYQAKRVAVTEVLRAHSVAREESIQQSPSVEKKEWRHTGAHKNQPRPNHVAMDHQIVPKDQPFELTGRDGSMYYPMYPRDPGLPASESVNCHCIHRGIVNKKILGLSYEERKARQQAFIDNDNGNFSRQLDSKNKAKAGINVSYEGENSKVKYDYEASVIDRKKIASAEYQNKFNSLGENKQITRSIRAKAKDMLRHRSGTQYEDLAYVNTKTGKTYINKSYNKVATAKPNKEMNKALKAADDYTIVGIHNHPNSSTPSIDDIHAAISRKYKYGLVVGHNGTIFKYTITGPVNEVNADIYLAKINTLFYNGDTKGLEKAIKGLSQNGVELEVF